MCEELGTYIDFTYLPKVRKKHRGQVIVFCSGAFDLTHSDHLIFFERCKGLGDILVVEVAHNDLIRKHKGKDRPVLDEENRLRMVGGLKPVDYCFLDVPISGKPLSLFDAVFRMLRPNMYVIKPDAFDIPYRRALAEKHGVELVILDDWYPLGSKRVSTTQIINKIRKGSTK